jgi:hypothetical protein
MSQVEKLARHRRSKHQGAVGQKGRKCDTGAGEKEPVATRQGNNTMDAAQHGMAGATGCSREDAYRAGAAAAHVQGAHRAGCHCPRPGGHRAGAAATHRGHGCRARRRRRQRELAAGGSSRPRGRDQRPDHRKASHEPHKQGQRASRDEGRRPPGRRSPGAAARQKGQGRTLPATAGEDHLQGRAGATRGQGPPEPIWAPSARHRRTQPPRRLRRGNTGRNAGHVIPSTRTTSGPQQRGLPPIPPCWEPRGTMTTPPPSPASPGFDRRPPRGARGGGSGELGFAPQSPRGGDTSF